ncbi:succinate-semialdehyde dehydrogenase [Erwinia sp. OLTSP20]|uniref:aldehyde dehydrogenase family protein n=1 Tax=unclassified Erwinia TaxID=2622719 RepID=UPI000C1922BF|nr:MULTISPECIES: aldehyde dehydrogenase family protein [unclassified Erwinia]PIJ51710.1 succinate-semialdehyde dehydrogenase [Erwinia sp. OAMSP11]PIJ75597.1 succinate-semialdehyde dehydrogenase [Erwinia sp. OLSSP12]PIJ84902.1 succinate-semialdehyde dehydrogenase [Erwinia sp. OLCASP19]PIJ86681.1 succinate-semialdehyde dehydrogenase [Erwinia sp. OLMTSP26]PIJ88122.1 succinate-semialdehyde dehydrogenase [Erwinia sp. OLMDSP33]
MANVTPLPARSVNPTNGEILNEWPWDSQPVISQLLETGHQAFVEWQQTPLAQRASTLQRLAQLIRRDSEKMARLIVMEMGKPINQARGEVEKSARLCEWYAQHGPAMLADEPAPVEQGEAVIAYRPLGMLLAIMPWNFPLWQVLRGAVPALIAGNVWLLKPAPSVMGCAYLIRDWITEAGFPAGALGVLNVAPDVVSAVMADERIAAITLTGSVSAGAAVASRAGALVKKCVLELGGSDPFIVLKDADLDEAVQAAVTGRYQNTGQVCAAAKRMIVEKPLATEFTRRFVAAVSKLNVGDPMAEETWIGPMARADLRDELHQQVQASLAEGASLLLGGNKVPGPGNWYQPTVLADVTPTMTAFRQELFGPVAAISVAQDAEHALALANDSDFGLCATLYTADMALANRMAQRLQCGGVFINGYSASDPRVAFGGVKKSGFGRELSHFGVREFCNAQTVWLDRK